MINREIVQIENISVDELADIIAEKLLLKMETRGSIDLDYSLLSRVETCEILKINKTTLWNWTKKGKLIAYGIGNRVYYKRGEVMNAMIRIN